MGTIRDGKEGFKFCKIIYMTELTGMKAYSIPEFVEVIKNIDGMSIFHHTFHNLIEGSCNFSEYSNDFSIWASHALKDEVLAEQLAAISMGNLMNIEEIRKKIIESAEKAKPICAPDGHEFNFMKCTIGKFATGKVANNLEELIDGLEKLDTKSIFYHLYLSKIIDAKHENVLSDWLYSQDLIELADSISSLESKVYDLEILKSNMLSILKRK